MRSERKHKVAAEYPVARAGATAPMMATSASPRLAFVLGDAWLASTPGRRLYARRAVWLHACEEWLERLAEFVPAQRLREIYRAPLRVDRQVVAACHELQVAALMTEMARHIEIDVTLPGGRHADLCVEFLSRRFHVEVKTHELRHARDAPGNLRTAQALLATAMSQASPETPNLLVLGGVRPQAVRAVARALPAYSPWSAVAHLELRATRVGLRSRGALHLVPQAAHPFSRELGAVLVDHWLGR